MSGFGSRNLGSLDSVGAEVLSVNDGTRSGDSGEVAADSRVAKLVGVRGTSSIESSSGVNRGRTALHALNGVLMVQPGEEGGG